MTMNLWLLSKTGSFFGYYLCIYWRPGLSVLPSSLSALAGGEPVEPGRDEGAGAVGAALLPGPGALPPARLGVHLEEERRSEFQDIEIMGAIATTLDMKALQFK